MPFQAQPLLDFIAKHVPDSQRAASVVEDVLPLLHGFVDRAYTFEPVGYDDLEPIRASLEKLLGFSVREVRVLSLETFFAPVPDESSEKRAERLGKEIVRVGETLVDIDALLEIFDPYFDLRVPEVVMEELIEAFDACFGDSFGDTESAATDPLYAQTFDNLMNTYITPVMLVLTAAVVKDDIVYARAAAFLPWLAKCVPIGELLGEAGVYTVATTTSLL